MSTREKILSEIEAYLRRTGLNQSDFGELAMGNRSFVARLRKGTNVGIGSIERAQRWMDEHPHGQIAPRKQKTSEHAAA